MADWSCSQLMVSQLYIRTRRTSHETREIDTYYTFIHQSISKRQKRHLHTPTLSDHNKKSNSPPISSRLISSYLTPLTTHTVLSLLLSRLASSLLAAGGGLGALGIILSFLSSPVPISFSLLERHLLMPSGSGDGVCGGVDMGCTYVPYLGGERARYLDVDEYRCLGFEWDSGAGEGERYAAGGGLRRRAGLGV